MEKMEEGRPAKRLRMGGGLTVQEVGSCCTGGRLAGLWMAHCGLCAAAFDGVAGMCCEQCRADASGCG